VLDVQELHVRYGSVEAVQGVSLAVEPGTVTVALGANGAGKSSALRAIAGAVRPSAGSVLLDGEDVTRLAAHHKVRRGLALVPEGRQVFAPLSVGDNLRLGGYTAKRSDAATTLRRVLDMFPILRDRIDSAAGLLSGGEQQMLAFGRVLMSQPRVVLMDEPTMGLAPVVVDTILQKVREMAEDGLTILMVEQNTAAVDVADNVIAVARGRIAFSGTADQARENSSVLKAFLGEEALGQTV
jgi:branched-chain amino acid transport system ATP-binding protein